MFDPGKQVLQIKEVADSEEFELRDLTLSVKGDLEQFNEINILLSWLVYRYSVFSARPNGLEIISYLVDDTSRNLT